MSQYQIKISGSGTLNQLAVRMIDIGRKLQIEDFYGVTEDLEGTKEDGCLIIEIQKE
tara:strand:+ start:741 stop:911 length:171 start_codon:yes stop_codon:yes gene_type:complete